MSYSKLVQFVRLSPNCTRPRNRAVDTITVHHMAADGSLEALGELFSQSARQASANYGIDSQGRIGCFVEEENRSWCSGNAANDHRAITIEVANSTGQPEWAVSDAAYESLLELCADICRRHGFRLQFTGDTTGNLTMHKWFQATGCPGPWMEARFPEIAREVNRRLEGSAPEPDYTLGLSLLRKGNRGEAVKALQSLLLGRGQALPLYGIDGDFGDETRKAVLAYQKGQNLDADGIVGEKTMGRLLGVKG